MRTLPWRAKRFQDAEMILAWDVLADWHAGWPPRLLDQTVLAKEFFAFISAAQRRELPFGRSEIRRAAAAHLGRREAQITLNVGAVAQRL